ncbi:MAG: 30S ribosomal protein S21 [Candidatus Cryosericum sp.]|jgi:small subunit ribosomal protein S21
MMGNYRDRNRDRTEPQGEDAQLENMLRRYKQDCIRDGLFGELKKRRFFMAPSEKRKQKSIAARRRR